MGSKKKKAGQYDNLEAIRKKLGLKKWRDLDQKKALEVLEMMHKIEGKTRLELIKQVPQIVTCTVEATKSIKEVACQKEKISLAVVNSLNRIIDSLDNISRQKNISCKDRRYIVDRMLEVAEILKDIDDNNKDFLLDVIKAISAIAVFAIAFIVIILTGGRIGGPSADLKSGDKDLNKSDN